MVTSPRIVVDLRATQSRHHAERGIARYTNELAQEIERQRPGLVTDYLFDADFPINAGAAWALNTGRARRSDRIDPEFTAAGGVYLVGSPFEEAPSVSTIVPPWIRSTQWAYTAILYDLIPLLFQDAYLDSPGANIAYRGRLPVFTGADHLFAISETSKRDAVEHLGIPPHRIDVIYAGTGDAYVPPATSPADLGRRLATSERFAELRPPYLLFTGGVDFRKNLDGLLEAYRRFDPGLRRRHQLVVVCKLDDESRRRLDAQVAELGISEDVFFTGFVSDAELVELTQAAHLAVFPSRYEGFGLPVLEARRCGVPVVCSANSSLAEIVTDPEALFDADDPDDMAMTISHALQNADVLERLRASEIPDRFTWEAAAVAVADRLGALADRSTSMRGSHRRAPRVAAVLDGEVPEELADVIRRAVADRARFWVGPDADVQRGVEESIDGPADVIVRFITRHTPSDVLDRIGARRESLVLLEANLCRARGVGRETFDEHAARWMVTHYGARYRMVGDGLADVGFDAARSSGMLAAGDLRRSPRLVTWHDHLASLVELDAGVRPEVVPFDGPDPSTSSDGVGFAGDVDLVELARRPGFMSWIDQAIDASFRRE